MHNFLSNVVHKQTDKPTLSKTWPPIAKEVMTHAQFYQLVTE